jgi:hypothetical protein
MLGIFSSMGDTYTPFVDFTVNVSLTVKRSVADRLWEENLLYGFRDKQLGAAAIIPLVRSWQRARSSLRTRRI